jgi:hypothetical protein
MELVHASLDMETNPDACGTCGRTNAHYIKIQRTNTETLNLITFWKADNLSTDHDIPCLLWNWKVQYRVHNSPSPVTIMRSLIQSTTYESIS